MSSMISPSGFGTRLAALGSLSAMRRGRPVLRVVPPRYPNRLRELREHRGFTQERLSELSGVSGQHISALERGEKQIIPTTGRRLARALDCSLGELLGESPGAIVPLRFWISFYFSEGRPDCYEMAAPHGMLAPGPRVILPENCFAAEVFDDSAKGFPPGTILFFRPLGDGAALHQGMRILVRFTDASHFRATREHETREILFGRLEISLGGSLYLRVSTDNPTAPDILVIQQAEAFSHAEAAEEQARLLGRPLSYELDAAAEGVIIGELAWVSGPP